MAHFVRVKGICVYKLLVFVFFAFLYGCSEQVSDVEYLQRAKNNQNQGNLEAAVVELKNALNQNPNNPEARFLLGTIYVELGVGAAAEKELRRAEKLGVAREAIMVPFGKSLLMQGKFLEVVRDITPLQSASAVKRAEVYALHGDAYYSDGKMDEAAEAYGLAKALVPGLVAAHVGEARLAAARNDLELARSLLANALEGDPAAVEAWRLLGEIELVAGNAAEAEVAFGNAVEFRKYPSLELAKRALARIQLNKYSEADADIQHLKAKGFKGHPYVNYVAGISYFKQGKYPEAAEAFQASHTVLPTSVETEMYLATTHYLLGNLEQAKDFAERVSAKVPSSLGAKRLQGAIDISRSDFGAATEVLHTALRQSPDDVIVLSMLGTASLYEGNTVEGVNYYQKVVTLQPDSREAKDMLMVAKLLDGQALDDFADLGQFSAEDDDYTREFLAAVAAFKDGELDGALKRAKELHDRYPDKVDPLKLMAACYLAAGRWDQAKIELEKALELQLDEPSAVRNLAKVEAQQGNLERARTLLKALVEAYPRDEQAILLLAENEALLGNQVTSTRLLEQGVERNPNALSLRAKLAGQYLRAGELAKVLEITRNLTDKQAQARPNLLELRGKAQMRAGDLVSARRSFQRWTEVAPDSAQAHFFYGASLERSGEIDLQRKQLERAVALDPDYVPARVGEIKVMVHAGKLEGAKDALGKLRRDFGPRPEVLGIEGWFALGTGNYATAADRLSAVPFQNRNTETTILLVRALWLQEKRDEAVEVMKTWLKSHPQDVAVLLQLAGSYLTLNREEEAIPLYARVVELQPNHLPALNNLAWLSREKDLKQAVGYAERAYELSPNDPYVLDTYGVLLLRTGDATRGHRMIQRAAERSPKDLTIQLHLARALVQQKQSAEARAVLNALVEEAPDAPSAKEAKALLESIPE